MNQKLSDFPVGFCLREYLTDLRVVLIKKALKECGGVKTHAADLLGMHRTTLSMMMKRLGISNK